MSCPWCVSRCSRRRVAKDIDRHSCVHGTLCRRCYRLHWQGTSNVYCFSCLTREVYRVAGLATLQLMVAIYGSFMVETDMNPGSIPCRRQFSLALSLLLRSLKIQTLEDVGVKSPRPLFQEPLTKPLDECLYSLLHCYSMSLSHNSLVTGGSPLPIDPTGPSIKSPDCSALQSLCLQIS